MTIFFYLNRQLTFHRLVTQNLEILELKEPLEMPIYSIDPKFESSREFSISHID